jgi:hypothetical protein
MGASVWPPPSTRWPLVSFDAPMILTKLDRLLADGRAALAAS